MVSKFFIKAYLMINIIFSEEYKNHDTGNHPESIKRIEVVKQNFRNILFLLSFEE